MGGCLWVSNPDDICESIKHFLGVELIDIFAQPMVYALIVTLGERLGF